MYKAVLNIVYDSSFDLHIRCYCTLFTVEDFKGVPSNTFFVLNDYREKIRSSLQMVVKSHKKL